MAYKDRMIASRSIAAAVREARIEMKKLGDAKAKGSSSGARRKSGELITELENFRDDLDDLLNSYEQTGNVPDAWVSTAERLMRELNGYMSDESAERLASLEAAVYAANDVSNEEPSGELYNIAESLGNALDDAKPEGTDEDDPDFYRSAKSATAGSTLPAPHRRGVPTSARLREAVRRDLKSLEKTAPRGVRAKAPRGDGKITATFSSGGFEYEARADLTVNEDGGAGGGYDVSFENIEVRSLGRAGFGTGGDSEFIALEEAHSYELDESEVIDALQESFDQDPELWADKSAGDSVSRKGSGVESVDTLIADLRQSAIDNDWPEVGDAADSIEAAASESPSDLVTALEAAKDAVYAENPEFADRIQDVIDEVGYVDEESAGDSVARKGVGGGTVKLELDGVSTSDIEDLISEYGGEITGVAGGSVGVCTIHFDDVSFMQDFVDAIGTDSESSGVTVVDVQDEKGSPSSTRTKKSELDGALADIQYDVAQINRVVDAEDDGSAEMEAWKAAYNTWVSTAESATDEDPTERLPDALDALVEAATDLQGHYIDQDMVDSLMSAIDSYNSIVTRSDSDVTTKAGDSESDYEEYLADVEAEDGIDNEMMTEIEDAAARLGGEVRGTGSGSGTSSGRGSVTTTVMVAFEDKESMNRFVDKVEDIDGVTDVVRMGGVAGGVEYLSAGDSVEAKGEDDQWIDDLAAALEKTTKLVEDFGLDPQSPTAEEILSELQAGDDVTQDLMDLIGGLRATADILEDDGEGVQATELRTVCDELENSGFNNKSARGTRVKASSLSDVEERLGAAMNAMGKAAGLASDYASRTEDPDEADAAEDVASDLGDFAGTIRATDADDAEGIQEVLDAIVDVADINDPDVADQVGTLIQKTRDALEQALEYLSAYEGKSATGSPLETKGIVRDLKQAVDEVIQYEVDNPDGEEEWMDRFDAAVAKVEEACSDGDPSAVLEALADAQSAATGNDDALVDVIAGALQAVDDIETDMAESGDKSYSAASRAKRREGLDTKRAGEGEREALIRDYETFAMEYMAAIEAASDAVRNASADAEDEEQEDEYGNLVADIEDLGIEENFDDTPMGINDEAYEWRMMASELKSTIGGGDPLLNDEAKAALNEALTALTQFAGDEWWSQYQDEQDVD